MRRRREGFTLLELVVVIVIVGLGTALVAPALAPPEEAPTTLAVVLSYARDVAVRRGEVLALEVADDGAWRLRSASSASEGILVSGRLEDDRLTNEVRLRISPHGSCGPDWGFEAAARRIDLDLLTCSIDS